MSASRCSITSAGSPEGDREGAAGGLSEPRGWTTWESMSDFLCENSPGTGVSAGGPPVRKRHDTKAAGRAFAQAVHRRAFEATHGSRHVWLPKWSPSATLVAKHRQRRLSTVLVASWPRSAPGQRHPGEHP